MFRNSLTVVAVCALTACSTQKYVPLNPTDKSSLSSIEMRGWLPQDEVYVVAKSPGASAALGGGLIGALIDSQVAKGRQADIHALTDPFYASVDDVDFRATFWSVMTPQAQASFGSQLQSIKTSPSAGDLRDAKKALEALPTTQGMLVVHTRYAFTEDYGNLISSTSVDLYRGGNTAPVFSNIYHYKSKSAEANRIQAWSASNGKAYRVAVAEIAHATATMLALDLKHPRINGVDQDIDANLGKVDALGQSALWPFGLPPLLKISGPVLERQDGREVIRDADGRLWSLPR